MFRLFLTLIKSCYYSFIVEIMLVEKPRLRCKKLIEDLATNTTTKCQNLALNWSGFCSEHIPLCQAKFCGNYALRGEPYCSSHSARKCAYKECQRVAIHQGYCRRHANLLEILEEKELRNMKVQKSIKRRKNHLTFKRRLEKGSTGYIQSSVQKRARQKYFDGERQSRASCQVLVPGPDGFTLCRNTASSYGLCSIHGGRALCAWKECGSVALLTAPFCIVHCRAVFNSCDLQVNRHLIDLKIFLDFSSSVREERRAEESHRTQLFHALRSFSILNQLHNVEFCEPLEKWDGSADKMLKKYMTPRYRSLRQTDGWRIEIQQNKCLMYGCDGARRWKPGFSLINDDDKRRMQDIINRYFGSSFYICDFCKAKVNTSAYAILDGYRLHGCLKGFLPRWDVEDILPLGRWVKWTHTIDAEWALKLKQLVAAKLIQELPEEIKTKSHSTNDNKANQS